MFRVIVLTLVVMAGACGGGSPQPLPGSLPAADHLHALRVTDDGALLLGLHGSLWRSDDGSRWEALGLDGQDAMALGVAVDGAPLLVGGHDLLARSTDGGETFEMLAPGLPSLDIHALAQAPSEPTTVYAFVVGSGLHHSSDAGDTWGPGARVGDGLPGDVTALAVDPGDPSTVVMGSGGNGILRSTDGGATFTPTSEYGALGLAFGDDGEILAATARGVDLSTDGGRTWDNLAGPDTFDGQPIAVGIGPDGTRWVVTESPRVLYRSRDGDAFEEVVRA